MFGYRGLIMREVSLFWKRARIKDLDVGEVTAIFKHLEFISYVKRVPKDITCIFKATFQDGKSPQDLDRLYFLDLLEVILEPKDNSDSFIIMVRVNHSLSNLNVRTNATSTVAGSRLDGEGITYIIQGPPIKLRIVSAFARLILKPDRISARSLDFEAGAKNKILSTKQLKLAKFAYDRGYFEVPKRTRISELAQEVGLARATISEHLARIESILMDDMFSSFDQEHIDPSLVRELIETITTEDFSDDYDQNRAMIETLKTIKKTISDEITEIMDKEVGTISDDDMIKLAVEEYNENISHIDSLLENGLDLKNQ